MHEADDIIDSPALVPSRLHGCRESIGYWPKNGRDQLFSAVDEFLHTETPPRIVGVGDKRAGHILGGVRTTISDQLLYEPGYLTINAGHETTVDLIDHAIYLLVYGDSADEFDPGRKNKEHLAFGYGPHRCPGAHLARLEAGVALPALFERFPRMKFAVSPAELGSVPGFIANGHARLPVLLT